MFRLGLYCYANDVSVTEFLSFRNSSLLLLTYCLQEICDTVFIFNIYDNKNICNWHLKHPEKYPATIQKSSSSQPAGIRCCNKTVLCACIYWSTNEWGSISQNSLSLSKFRSVCTAVRRHNCWVLPEQLQVLEEGSSKWPGTLPFVKLRGLQRFCLDYVVTSFRGSSNHSVLLQSQITHSKRSCLNPLCYPSAREFRGCRVKTPKNFSCFTQTMISLAYLYCWVIYIEVTEEKVIILRNDAFFLKHSIKKNYEFRFPVTSLLSW